MGKSTRRPVNVRVPKRVKIGARVYSIDMTADGWVNRPDQDHDRTGWGQTYHKKMQIFINPELSEYARRETLMHEVLHCLYAVSGADVRNSVGHGNDEFDIEEYTVSRLEAPMMSFLIDNPELVAYLVIGEHSELVK